MSLHDPPNYHATSPVGTSFVDAVAPELASAPRRAYARPMTGVGESSGLQQVMLNERPRLLRFLAARGAGDEAEDIFHDLWQRIASIPAQPIADSVAYLFRAAENVMRDHRRSALTRARRQHDWHSTRADVEEPLGTRGLVAREQLREVEATLAKLGPRVDRIFRRYRLEGVGQAVIARELGISLSSVEKDLRKAYDALAGLKVKFDAE